MPNQPNNCSPNCKPKRVEADDDNGNLAAEDLANIWAAERVRDKGELISLEQLKTRLEIWKKWNSF